MHKQTTEYRIICNPHTPREKGEKVSSSIRAGNEYEYDYYTHLQQSSAVYGINDEEHLVFLDSATSRHCRHSRQKQPKDQHTSSQYCPAPPIEYEITRTR
mmetsp:Transcript_21649/g.33958  ORF Transcript_21649/g.33958 Transcript_21649/m.33958 type:complete len:100 (-) Transcript_21649:309-608(-)